MKRGPLSALGIVVLSLACLTASCAKQSGAPDRAKAVDGLQAAYEAAAAIQSTARVDGVYADYVQRISDASVALTSYTPTDDAARAIVSHLSAALYAYQSAARAWETKTAECEDCAWRKFRDAHPQLALPPGADSDYAMRLLWDSAAGELKAAQVALAARKH